MIWDFFPRRLTNLRTSSSLRVFDFLPSINQRTTEQTKACPPLGLLSYRIAMQSRKIQTRSLVKVCKAFISTSTLVIVSFLLSWAAPLAGDANGVVLQGVYSYAVYQGAENPLYSERYSFEVLLDGCSWAINCEDTSAFTNTSILDTKRTASCDGTNIYAVTFQSESAAKEAWGNNYDSVKGRLPLAMAHIYSGDYPSLREPVIHNIWLAFASRCTFSNANGLAKPPFVVDMSIFGNTNYFCNYKWEIDDNEPSLRKLVYTDLGTTYVRNPKTGELSQIVNPPPYDKGYTTAMGRWLRSTNIDGVLMPTDFEFTAFAPNQNGKKATDLLKASSYRCIITNIFRRENSKIPTDLPEGKVLVSDRRFEKRGNAYITYEISDGRWRATNEPFISRLLETAPRISLEDEALAELGIQPIGSTFQKFKATHSGTKTPKVLLFLCFIVFPVGFIVFKLSRKTTNKKPNVKI